ncbi:MAG: hypothetical protein NUV45_02210 [Tepidanaerobacteraceae bacterium]|jgi:hypothetical protein|nr:hypothetical protein [Tepidanaerobacteraceae bacterium]
MFVMIVPMLASCSPKAENSIDENTVAKAEDESPSSESAPFYRSKVAYAA